MLGALRHQARIVRLDDLRRARDGALTGKDGVKIAYLVQDLADPANERRVITLRRGGAEIDLYGFRRAGGTPDLVGGVVPHEIGQALHYNLSHRALVLLKHGATVGGWARRMAEADVIVARNLDNLLLAALARRRFGLRTPLVYELLDVHTIMIKDGAASRLARALEGWLLRECAAVLVSSPAFEREYLARYHLEGPPCRLVENKVLAGAPTPLAPPRDGPPWRIGWFGGIRCNPSWKALTSLVRANPGLVEVHIRGRFINPEMGDVLGVIRDNPGLYYHGPYKSPEDLPKIYGDIHFAWAVDLSQDDANSHWLLPNRLYEGGLHGAVPIALSGSETGRWLARHGVGLLIDQPLEQSAGQLLATMTLERYRRAAERILAADPTLFRWTEEGCKDLVDGLAALQAPAHESRLARGL